MVAIVNFYFMGKKRKFNDIGYFGGGYWYNTEYEIVIKHRTLNESKLNQIELKKMKDKYTYKFTPQYTIVHHTTLYFTILQYTILHYTVLQCTTIHYNTIYYTTMHYNTIQYNILHYTTIQYTNLDETNQITK